MEILPIAGGILGLVGLAGGAAGYFKAARGNAIIDLQATEINTLTGKSNRLEKDMAAVSAERDRLKEENGTLKELAQGSPQLIKLTEAVEANTKVIADYIKTGAK